MTNIHSSDIDHKLEAALKYAQKGWTVVPTHSVVDGKCTCGNPDCGNPGKHPLYDKETLPHGLKNATTDPKQVSSWWEKWPGANIGAATGKKTFIVLDVDGPEGTASLKALEEQYGKLPETVTSITGGNGKHVFFKAPEKEIIRNSASKVGKHIDIRGDGGYIVMPPSDHKSGNKYQWEKGRDPDSVEMALMPPWLVDLANGKPKKNEIVPCKQLLSAVTVDVTKEIPSGRRNDVLFRHGCSLRRKGGEYDEIHSELLKLNSSKCQPPLDTGEIDTIANSIMRYSPGTNWDNVVMVRQIMSKIEDRLGTQPSYGSIIKDTEIVEFLARLSALDQQKFEGLMEELRGKGLKVRETQDLKRVVKSKRKELESQAANLPTLQGSPVTDFFEDPPVSKEYMIPAGYIIGFDGISKAVSKKGDLELFENVIPAPVFIQGRLKNISDSTEFTFLIWFRDNYWQTHTVPRSVVADSQKIISLSDIGFPVDSVNARELIRFLSKLEALNIKFIIKGSLSTKFGGLGHNFDKGFLFGLRHIPGTGKIISRSGDLDNFLKNQGKKGTMYFYPADFGEYNFAKGYGREGSLKKSLKIFKFINQNPIIAFMCYSACAAPLLKILGQTSFMIDLSGPTTRGKTTALRVAASLFGDPNPSSATSIVRSWNSTQVFLERTTTMVNDLPVFLDDTKLIHNPDVVSTIIYQAAFGQGRGRGTITGMASVSTWHSVLISTGENKILDLVNKGDGGAHGRVIPICTPPFAKQSKIIANKINRINNIISVNYGHAGLKFVRYLLKNRELWPQWNAKFRVLHKLYSSNASEGIMNRLASNFAVIHLAAELLNDALGLDLKYEKHLDIVFRSVDEEVNRESNIAKEALKMVVEWAASKQDDFFRVQAPKGSIFSKDSNERIPAQGWLGSWKDSGDLAIIPVKLYEFLNRSGYKEPKAIVKQWREDQWIKTPKGRGLTMKRVVGTESVRCVVIDRRIIDKINSNKL